MRVTYKNNKLLKRLNIVAIFIVTLTFILEFNYAPSYILNFFVSIILTLDTWYLISVLQFAGEKVSVQTPFSIFLGIGIIQFMSGIFPFDRESAGAATCAYGVLDILLALYIALMTFKVTDARFSLPFRLLGLSFIITMGFRIIVLLFVDSVVLRNLMVYMNFIDLLAVLPLFAVLNIINKTGKILNDNSIFLINDQTTA